MNVFGDCIEGSARVSTQTINGKTTNSHYVSRVKLSGAMQGSTLSGVLSGANLPLEVNDWSEIANQSGGTNYGVAGLPSLRMSLTPWIIPLLSREIACTSPTVSIGVSACPMAVRRFFVSSSSALFSYRNVSGIHW